MTDYCISEAVKSHLVQKTVIADREFDWNGGVLASHIASESGCTVSGLGKLVRRLGFGCRSKSGLISLAEWRANVLLERMTAQARAEARTIQTLQKFGSSGLRKNCAKP